VLTHVIFVHGLNGHYSETFSSSGAPAELWPRWLEAIDGVAVWGIDYSAPASRWQTGAAMHLADRARNILPLLVHEQGLSRGAIVLVGYSFGGLVIKQMLRVAQDGSGQNEKVGDFVRRVRKVAFIATPHAGSDQASWMQRLSPLVRPRETTLGLVRNHGGLRDLNLWYRDFSTQHEIENLVLWETQPYHFRCRILGRELAIPFGFIVKPDSSDPGLPAPVQIIPIEADHVSIVHPSGRDTDVYIHVSRFVAWTPSGKHQDTHTRTALREIRSAIDDQAAASGAAVEKITAAINALGVTGQRGTAHAENPIVTKVLDERLWRLRKARHLKGFDALKETSRLFEDIQNGELAAAGRQSKQVACAWCARIASSADINASRVMLSAAQTYGDAPENNIAEAFQKLHGDKDRDGALALLSNLSSPMASSARFIIVRGSQTADEALAWMQAAGMDIGDLDADGKFFVVSARVAAEQWNDAIKDVDRLGASDFKDSPALEDAAACIHLAAAVHDELKSTIFQLLPLDLKGFPLATDPASLDRCKMARDLFVQSAKALQDVGNPASAEDFALWLDLRNPASVGAALQALKESLNDPARRLRRVPFAIEFGVPLDLVEVERAIEREIARTGGKSFDAVRARLALARTRGSDKEVAAYIRRHHAQLTTYFHANFINGLLIEKLAASGDTSEAQSLLDSLTGTLGQDGIESLQAIIEEAKAEDPTALREAQYASTQSLSDLGVLVDLLEARRAWSKLVPFAKLLFEQTHDSSALKRYVESLQRVGDCAEIEELYGRYPDMFDAGGLMNAVAWARFRLGRLHDAQALLTRAGAEAAKDFRLASNLGIGTGDWTALGALVEEQWAARDALDAAELLYAGQLAALAGSHRASDLVKAAAKKAGGHPAILVGCYVEATGGGWEDDPETHRWLHEALQNSGSDGPIKRVDLKSVLESAPAWNEREDKTWKGMTEGRLPIFAAGLALNRSLLSMFLVPALSNLSQSDPRRRSVVFAFSGARPAVETDARRIALDATSLLALSYLGILKQVCEHFDRVVVSPNTLSWLLEERKRIRFHQPSRVKRALELKRCVDNGQVCLLDEISVPDAKLEQEVGSALAQMLTAARGASDGRQHVVVRSYPLHRAGSLMDEVADVRGYEDNLAAVGELVQALRGCGQVTAAEEKRAMTYLRLQETAWRTA
jgi:hypothetical protein